LAIQVDDLCPLLQVFDMSTSVSFYRDVLGFEIVDSAPAGEEWDWVWLRLNDTNLMLNTAYESPHRPANPDSARVRAHADTVLFFGCPDVDGAHEQLLAHGLDVEAPTVAPYGMKQLTVADPDGYQLCFQWPAT
jgi:catechol 2,3-dioxygenase-like lactoylglutathione lyase family enzyme